MYHVAVMSYHLLLCGVQRYRGAPSVLEVCEESLAEEDGVKGSKKDQEVKKLGLSHVYSN